MLAQAREKKDGKNIQLCIGDAGYLPFLDNSFDLITISFATRNINPNKKKLTDYIKEFHRVTKTGGHFLHLETSQPKSGILRRLFHQYIKFVVRPVGTFLSGSKAGYKYLSHTIPRFYSPEDFTKIMQEAGFKQIKVHKLLLGVAAIHNGKKL
jgi:demethylmenaquinone methyltransferase/2-methoxy-6-polyprenyl-1,4-benzoquinol methylase